jgi:type IV pilus assembly protein PilM
LGSMSLGSKSGAVGLDIGVEHIRVARLNPVGSALQLVTCDWLDTPAGAVVEGEVLDPVAVSAALRELWRKSGVTTKDVVLGVANQQVVVRLIDLPFMDRNELAGAIQYQAHDYIPIPIEDAILDFQVVGDYMTPAGEHMVEVLLVAAQRQMLNSVVSAVENAGLRPVMIDVTPFAVARALIGENQSVLPDEDGQAVAIVHMTAGITTICVVERGVPRFTRVSSIAGREFTQAVSNALEVTFEDAERAKVQVGLPGVSDATVPAGGGDDEEMVKKTQEALEREVNRFTAEIRRSLDYYLTQSSQARTIKTILLTGSSAQLTNLAAYLETGLQTEVRLADALARIETTPTTQGLVEADRYGAVAAIGLAMGGLRQ